MRSKPNPALSSAIATSPVTAPKLRACRTCRGTFPTGSLTAGECSTCAGLLALPLRGEGGKFISFDTRPATNSAVEKGGDL